MSHQEARDIKFGQQVKHIQRVLLGTQTQEVLMLLTHILGQISLFLVSLKLCYQIWAVKPTP